MPLNPAHPARRALLPFILAMSMLVVPAGAGAEVRREILTNAEPTNLVNIIPIRIEEDVQPGQRTTAEVSIFNDSDKTVQMTAQVVDLGPPDDPTTLGQPLEAGSFEFGAAAWISPEVRKATLAPFEKIVFALVIEPPADAPVGSSYGGVEFEFVGGEGEAGEGQVAVRITSLLQVLLDVPGEVERKLTLLEAKTRDSFHVGDTSFVSYGLRYRNDGTVTDHVEAKVVVKSIFGNTAATIDLGERLLIRGATGADRAVWSDVPPFGIFSATAEVKGDDGEVHRRNMGRVVILPPWWVLALLAAAIILPPIWVWWRRRQEWLLYMDDEYWDEEEDGEYA